MISRLSPLKAIGPWIRVCTSRPLAFREICGIENVTFCCSNTLTFPKNELRFSAIGSRHMCTAVEPTGATHTTFSNMSAAVGGTLKINLLGVDTEVDVRTGENLEEIQLKAWWKRRLEVANEDAFEIASNTNIISLNMQHNEARPILLKLGAIMPSRWCSLILEAGKRLVEIQSLREANLTVKTNGGDVKLGELRGNEAFIDSNGGCFSAGLVSSILKLNSGGGGISMKKALGTTMHMDSGGGDVVIGFAYGEDVRIISGGGHVEIKHLQAQQMAYVSTGGGAVKIDGLDGNLEIFSGGGNVQLQLLTNAKEVKIDAGAGDVTLYLPSQENVNVEYTGDGKLIEEDSLKKSSALPSFYAGDLDMQMRQRMGHYSCRVLISGSGTVTTKRRSWLEAVMPVSPIAD